MPTKFEVAPPSAMPLPGSQRLISSHGTSSTFSTMLTSLTLFPFLNLLKRGPCDVVLPDVVLDGLLLDVFVEVVGLVDVVDVLGVKFRMFEGQAVGRVVGL